MARRYRLKVRSGPRVERQRFDDLDAALAAEAARRLGLSAVPLLCAREIDVAGALPRVIRLMVHCYADAERPARHVYLRDAVALRRDLEAAQ